MVVTEYNKAAFFAKSSPIFLTFFQAKFIKVEGIKINFFLDLTQNILSVLYFRYLYGLLGARAPNIIFVKEFKTMDQ